MRHTSLAKAAGIGLLCLALAGCKTSEERAEDFYQAGVQLAQEGDYDRAIVEFRNVFQLDGSHQEARHALAEIHMRQGDLRSAYSQYLRLVEQYPDDIEARMQLAEIAFRVRNWDEFRRHGTVVQEAGLDSPRARAIDVGLAYEEAVQSQQPEQLRTIAEQAEQLRADNPDSDILLSILIDSAVRSGELDEALDYLDVVIAADPDNRAYYDQRLAVLDRAGDDAAIEAQLKEMVEQFPEDADVKGTLVRYYMSKQDMDSAEAFLRSVTSPQDEDPSLYLDLIRFLARFRGTEAAMAELDKAIESSPDPLPFQTIRAGMAFEAGERETAISALEEILDADPETSEEVLDVRVTLAKMLAATGNEVGARQQIEQVLAENPSQVEALKLRANWQIEDDQTDEAISNLRLAIDNAPKDAQALTLMARAYARAGNADLSQEFLSLAVEASNNAPEESIRYAQALQESERYLPAEDVLLSALRVAPQNVGLLGELGRVYLAMDDQARATQVIDTLRRLDTPEATQTANTLEAGQVERTRGPEEAIAFLEQLAQSEDNDLGARLMLVRARLSSGDTDKAMDLIDEMIEGNPDNTQLKAVRGVILEAAGKPQEAVDVYSQLLTENPQSGPLRLALSRLYARLGETEQARDVVARGLELNPGDPNLLWAEASFRERAGDIEGTIEIYERLYESSSNSVIAANNLASVLSSYRDDEESLDRAFTIARRLRGTEEPAFQDTYGWIALRRGDAEDALPYLESAAEGLPNDPVVQYHLGKAYLETGQTAEAMEQFRKSVDLAGPADTRPQIEDARAQIERLKTSPSE